MDAIYGLIQIYVDHHKDIIMSFLRQVNYIDICR